MFILKLVHNIVIIITNIWEKNPCIKTQKFLFLVYGGYYSMFRSSGSIFR